MVTKRQHYVPCSYLQFFDLTGIPRGRHSQVHVARQGGYTGIETVENLAFQNWTYSRADADTAEAVFHESERDYPEFARRMIDRLDPGPIGGQLLMAMMIDMHVRNPAYANRTRVERIRVAYPHLAVALLEVLVGLNAAVPAPKTESEKSADWRVRARRAHAILRRDWRVVGIRALSETFCTSDSPVLMFANTTTGVAIAMPISPTTYCLAYNTRHVTVTGSVASREDIALLNGIQVRYCNQAAFAHEALYQPEAEGDFLGVLERARSERWVSELEVHPNFVNPNLLIHLSFLALTPKPG